MFETSSGKMFNINYVNIISAQVKCKPILKHEKFNRKPQRSEEVVSLFRKSQISRYRSVAN